MSKTLEAEKQDIDPIHGILRNVAELHDGMPLENLN